MGFDHDLCNTGLVLGLGFSLSSSTGEHKSKKPGNSAQKMDCLGKVTDEPSLTLSLFGQTFDLAKKAAGSDYNYNKGIAVGDHHPDQYQSGDDHLYRQDSGASSFSNVSSVKREREAGSEEVEIERVISSRASDEDDDDGPNGRKKLRLTKAQSALLEESFKQQSTLNPKQKQELARKLKLRPRQVEVWFQNRRARTKLKQTEVDCEFLKKCCETLTDENRRLHKELQELKALKLAQPLYMQLPAAATLTMCPSCERIGGGGSGGGSENSPKSAFVMAPKPHFYNPFTNS